MRSACFIAYRSVSYLRVIEILLSYQTDQTQRHWLPNPHPPRDPTHTSGLRFIHTPSLLTHTGRGQSNKLGVNAVVIRGLSMVRQPLRCFPKCNPAAFCSSFLFSHIDCCIYTENQGGLDGKRKLRKLKKGVFLIWLIHKGHGFPLISAGTSCFHTAPSDSR